MQGIDCLSQTESLYSVLENARIKKNWFNGGGIVLSSSRPLQDRSSNLFNKIFSKIPCTSTDSVSLDVFMQDVIKVALLRNLSGLTLEERFVWRNIAHKIKQTYSVFNEGFFVSKMGRFFQRIEPSPEMSSLISGGMISFPVALEDLPYEIKKQIFSYSMDEKLKSIKALRPLLCSIDIEYSCEIIRNLECHKELERYVLLPEKVIQTYSEAKKFLRNVVLFINDVQEVIPQLRENDSPFAIATDIGKLKSFFRKLYMHQLVCCFGNKVEYDLGTSSFEVFEQVDAWIKSPEAQTLTQLDFSSKGLFCVPDQIKTFKSLKSLNLKDNNLRTLPWELIDLPKLKRLDIGNNKFCGGVFVDVLCAIIPHLSGGDATSFYKCFSELSCDTVHGGIVYHGISV